MEMFLCSFVALFRMKQWIFGILLLIIMITSVSAASVHVIDFSDKDEHKISVPVSDMVYFEAFDREVRLVLERVNPERQHATVKFFIKDENGTAPPLGLKVNSSLFARLDLDQDNEPDFVIRYLASDETSAVLSVAKFVEEVEPIVVDVVDVTGKAVDDKVKESEEPVKDSSTSPFKRTLLIIGIVVALIILFFIFKEGDDGKMTRDPVEGGFVIDASKKKE
tara:strand:+ start:123 stop:788 length:666 start_codon:yes stop_codon:yes gene_type:complete